MRVFVVSGSGLSADSGLSTFRGAAGLYEGMRAEEFLTGASYARDPAAVEAWIGTLRSAAMGAAPNAAHVALAQYQVRYPETRLFTQNVDLLLERAGAATVVHLHGRLDEWRCLGRGHMAPVENPGDWSAELRCVHCGSRVRSNVILFEEAAPAYAQLWTALRRARAADVLLVVGTQGTVLPIAEMVRQFPGRAVLQNLDRSEALPAGLFAREVPGRAETQVAVALAQVEAWRAGGR